MNRQNILLILGAVALVGGLFTFAVMMGGDKSDPDPEPAPAPVATIDSGAGPVELPPEEDPGQAAPGDHPEHEGEPDGHGGDPEDCESGPVACDDTDVVGTNPADYDAADLVRGIAIQFATAWAATDSAETPDARAARMTSAGASAEVASQMSILTRPNAQKVEMTVKTRPQSPRRVIFLGREDGLLQFQMSMNVDATYTYVDGSKTVVVAGGNLTVGVTDAGAVQSVTESFPTITEMD